MNKHPDLIVHEQTPFNAEPPIKLLVQTFVTPKELFYVRNHGTVPDIDPVAYRLSITGSVSQLLSLSLGEIREEFPKRTATATLYCAGNRRDELMQVAPIKDEEPWSAEAVSNAVWGGVPLFEVLREAGIDSHTKQTTEEQHGCRRIC